MRIFIDNIEFKKFIQSNFKKFDQTKIIEYKNIYSLEGIFRIQNNNIMKLIPKDCPIEKINYNKFTFLIDKSKYEFIKDIYYIPYDHIIHNIKQIEYKLNNKSKISLIIEYNNELKNLDQNILSEINNIYFSTNEKNLDKNLKDNIIEYLSLINNIKQC